MDSHPPSSLCDLAVLLGLMLSLCLLTACAGPADGPTPGHSAALGPPVAEQIPHTVRSPFGDRIDEYYWMRDDHPEAKNPRIMAHLKAEQAYTDAMTAHLAGLRSTLFTEMKSRLKPDDSSAPAFERGFWYSRRYAPGAEYPVYLRHRGTPNGPDPSASEQILLDGPALAAGEDFFSVGDVQVSPDGNLVAWTQDTVGRRSHTLRIRDLRTGTLLPDTIPGTLESVVWAADSRSLFYLRQDPVLLQSGPVMRHTLGADPAADTLVYDEPDKTLFTGIGHTASREYLLIAITGYDITEARIVPLASPAGDPTPSTVLVPRTPGVRTYADHLAGRWFLHTNRNARDFMLATADSPQAAADPARWRTLLPHRPGVSIEGFALFRSAVAVVQRSQANLTIALIDIPAADASTPPAEPRVIPAPGNLQAFSMSLGENRDSDFDRVRVVFTSMITPATTLDVHLRTGDAIVRKVQPVIGYDASLYRTARAWATTADGKRVPISLAWRNGLVQQNASAPVLIEGYGAYGIASDAEFRSEYVSLLDRGFLLAIAHVRGGSDLGQDWYEDGRLQHKRNSFTDFVAVADALADQRWCDPARRFAVGGSAGGLLMGAVANIGGDRFAGIVMDVPFVDVVTTMLDETIPLTTNEWTQWGNPLTDAAAYRTMLAYSPYDNLQPKPYPAILVTTGLWDSQVQYFEPAKYVARLRRLKTDANPLLFNINFDAGHGGNSGRFRSLEEDALRQAFILDLAGLRP